LGWLSKIFGKKETQIEDQKKEPSLEIDGLPNFLNEKYKEITIPIIEDAKKRHEEILTLSNSLQSNLKNLENAVYNKPIDEKLFTVIIGRRKDFIQKMNNVVWNLKNPIGQDYSSILSNHTKSLSTLKEVNNSTSGDYAYIKEIFGKEASLVVQNFKKIQNTLTNFTSLIEDKKEKLEIIKSSTHLMDEIKKKKISLNNKENLNLETLKNIEKYNTELKNTSIKLDELKNSSELEKLNEILSERNKIEEKISNINEELNQNISPLEKPIKKFNKLVHDNVIQFTNVNFISLFLSNPTETIIDEDLNEFKSLLEGLEKSILEKKIELKDREKRLHTIQNLKNTDLISNLVKELKNNIENMKEIENKSSELKIKDQIDKLEDDEKSWNKKIHDNKFEITKINSDIEKFRNSITDLKNNLEENIKSLSEETLTLNLNF